MRARVHLIVTAAGAAFGAVLFAYAVRQVGVDALADGARRVGWGFLAILALAGVRFMLRAECWRLCLPPQVPLDYPHAFSAFLAGDAVGNITPLGLLASEPTKVLLARRHLATLDSIASLTLENIIYSLSAATMIAFGLGLMLLTVPVPDAVRWTALGALAGLAIGAAIALAVLRAPMHLTGRAASSWLARLVHLRAALREFAAAHPDRLARVFSLHLVFHVLAIAETFLTLGWLLGDRRPDVVQAIVFETVNRLTTVAFKFVPFRIGVDEAASGAVAPLLALTAAAGVALAVVRKGRMLCWSAVGLVLVWAPAGGRRC